MSDSRSEPGRPAGAPARADARPAVPEPLKRFYKNAHVGPHRAEGHAVVLLDGRPVRTPRRAPLAAPVAVATAIAAEWQSQGEHIRPLTMPLTRLVNTAIDGAVHAVDRIKEDIATVAGSDLVLYRAEGPAGLVALQEAAWAPVVAFAERRLGVRLILAEGIMPVRQDERLGPSVVAALPDDPLALAAIHQLTTLTGSTFLALALADAQTSFEDAWAAAHVDEDWNIRQWGEDALAAERREARRRDARAALFVLHEDESLLA